MKSNIFAITACALFCLTASVAGWGEGQSALVFETQSADIWRRVMETKVSMTALREGSSNAEAANVPREVLDAENGVVIIWVQYEKPDGYLGTKGSGSGFVLDRQKGYLVTNAHVAKIAATKDTIFVELKNGLKPEAKLVGMDEARDIAVLQIDPAVGIPKALKLGKSNPDVLKVGDAVYSWGMPLRQKFTLGIGWVNSRIRTVPYKAIRTTIPINPGSSGGPLLNGKGEVVGINSAILSDAFIGHAFAIPISNVEKYLEQIVQTGKTTRGFLGIQAKYWEARHPQAINGSLPGAYGYVSVQSVMPGSAAERAGLQAGDSILSVNGKEIKDDILEIIQSVADSDPGQSLDIEVWNGKAAQQGKPIRLQVMLQDANNPKHSGLQNYF